MQTLLSHCLTYGLNERTKCMTSPTVLKIVPPVNFSLHFIDSEHFIDTRTRSKITNHDLLSVIDIFFNFSKQFSLKHDSNKCRKLLESFNKRVLKLLGRQAKNLQHNNFQKEMARSHNRYCFSKSI